MSDELDHLVKGVRKTGQLQLRRWLFLGCVALVGSWLVCFIVYAALDLALKLSVLPRIGAFLLTLFLLVRIGRRLLVRPLREPRPDHAVATDIEARRPRLETALSTSIEYGEDPRKAEALSSPTVVERLIHQAAERSEGAVFEDAVDWRLPKRMAICTAFLVVVIGLGFALAPTLFGPALRRFAYPLTSVDPPTLARVDRVTPGSRSESFERQHTRSPPACDRGDDANQVVPTGSDRVEPYIGPGHRLQSIGHLESCWHV